MKTLAKILLITLILGGLAAAAFQPVRAYWIAKNKTNYRQAEVKQGEIVSVVNATGKVQPVLRVQVGSFVSGPVVELNVDYNDRVEEGTLLAKIDPRLYLAGRARDEAALATRKAEVERATALLKQARNDEQRALDLYEENPDYVSDAELDQVKFNCIALEAQLKVAEAAVEQAEANLENAITNLEYTDIKSPVDGIVIERKIDPGQTLAAQFQTPELFIIAPEMDKRMFVYASINEAEIGRIIEAQKRGEKVEFTVAAYPDDLFEGKIHEVRINPTETQNVVTYPVVVEAPNPDMKLLPGMTADLSFQIEKREDVIKVPNAALRFYPRKEQVREEDRKLLDGAEAEDDPQDDQVDDLLSADQQVEANRERNRRHVWVTEGDLLRAVEIVTGLSDNRYTELVEGPLEEGQKLVTGEASPGT